MFVFIVVVSFVCIPVPEYKPEAALFMFTTFLENGEYAPPLEIEV